MWKETHPTPDTAFGDIVSYDRDDEDADKLASELVASAASSGNRLKKHVLPLERTAAACARLVAHLMVDQREESLVPFTSTCLVFGVEFSSVFGSRDRQDFSSGCFMISHVWH